MSDIARIQNVKSRLVNALDRQGRAQSSDEYRADEQAVADALAVLVELGPDRGAMLDYAHSKVDAMNWHDFD